MRQFSDIIRIFVTMESRNIRYDLVRSIAIILIIFTHAMGMVTGVAPAGWSPVRVEYAFLKTLISPGVHLFFLLSGALLLGKEEPVWLFYRKRLRRILIPFLLWSVVLYVLTGLKTPGFDWKHCLPDFGLKLLTNGIHGTYWFIYAILGLYLITPLLRLICRTKAGCTALLLLSLAVYCSHLAFPSVPEVPYLSCLVDYVAGYWFVRYLRRSKPVLILAAVALAMAILSEFFQMLLTENSFPFEILIAAALFVLIVHSLRAPKLSPAFQILGDCSLGIYLSHCIFISAFTLVAVRLGLPAATVPFFVGLGTLSVEWCLMALLRKLKLDRILA